MKVTHNIKPLALSHKPWLSAPVPLCKVEAQHFCHKTDVAPPEKQMTKTSPL